MADLASLAEFIRTGVATEFNPEPFYQPETDCLMYYARNERSYSERINSYLTIFLSMEDDTLVGIEVKSVSRILELTKEFNVCAFDKSINLGLFISMSLMDSEKKVAPERVEQLKKLSNVEVPQVALAA